MSNEHMVDKAAAERLEKEYVTNRLGPARGQGLEDDKQARHELKVAESWLAEARKLASKKKDDRAALLVDELEAIVTKGREAFRRFDQAEEALEAAKAAWRTAYANERSAIMAHKAGTLVGTEAMRLFAEREAASAAFRVRDRELTEAKRPAHPPKFIGLVRDAQRGEETKRLAEAAEKHGFDFSAARPGTDVIGIAQKHADSAKRIEALVWILDEEIAIDEIAEAYVNATERAACVRQLRELFAFRWQRYEARRAREGERR